MKIYYGKNKKEAKEITFKDLMIAITRAIKIEKRPGRFGDDSASWFNIRKFNEKGAVDVQIDFDPETDNSIIGVEVWQTDYKLDEDNSKQII